VEKLSALLDLCVRRRSGFGVSRDAFGLLCGRGMWNLVLTCTCSNHMRCIIIWARVVQQRMHQLHAMDAEFFFLSRLKPLRGVLMMRREKHALIITMTRRWACCFFKVATQYNQSRLFFSRAWSLPWNTFITKERDEREWREKADCKKVCWEINWNLYADGNLQ
jgi:hypothetical protein